MKRTEINSASHTLLRRTGFTVLLISLFSSFLIPRSSHNVLAREKAKPATAVGAAVPPPAQAREAYGKVSLAFEVNEGQTDPQVSFLTRANGATVFLTATEAVFTLAMPRADAGAAAASKSLEPLARAT